MAKRVSTAAMYPGDFAKLNQTRITKPVKVVQPTKTRKKVRVSTAAMYPGDFAKLGLK